MGREIRTRRIEKNIKMLDKSIVVTERLKNAYVRTKGSIGQGHKERERGRSEPIEYAENKVISAMGLSAGQSVRRVKTLSSSAGSGKHGYSLKKLMKNTEQAAQESQERIKRRKEIEGIKQTRKSSGRSKKVIGQKSDRVAFKSGKTVKIFEQPSYKKIKLSQVKAAQEAAKKFYVESKVSKDMTEKTFKTAGKPVREAGKKVKAGARAGTSAVRAVIASTRSLFTAITAGGSVTAFLLIFILLFGGLLCTVGGGNSSAVSPVSKEVEQYEPLIRKYANKYGIGEYVELLKAVMMQESGGRGLDPMQSSEGAFNKRYPRQPNGIKDPEYSIDCGVQELRTALVSAEVKNPLDMEHIKLALQGYNFGNGYISWAKRKYGGYSVVNAAEFSDMMAKRMGWKRYGDKEYVPHVLRYYAFGRIPTGIGNQSIVQVALSQEGNKGGRPYWSWYGYSGRVSWCACFVSWCADQCGYIDNGTVPKFSSCASGASWFKGKGRFKDRSYVPAPGDIIFFDWGSGVHHVGIVVDVTNGKVNTIEGNSGDAVRRRSYKIGDSRIYGYGVYAF